MVIPDHLVHYENATVTPICAGPRIGDIIHVDRTADGTGWLGGLPELAS